MRAKYTSDVIREQFERIRGTLESCRKLTHPRTVDLYDVFCAVLYVMREGCRWRSLPHDFPKWENVYKHYRIWSEPGADGVSVLDKVLDNGFSDAGRKTSSIASGSRLSAAVKR